MFKNSSEIFAYIKKEDVKLVDVRFTDLPGIQHHFNVPVESFDENGRGINERFSNTVLIKSRD